MVLTGWVTIATGITFIDEETITEKIIIPGRHTLNGLNRSATRYRIRERPVIYFSDCESKKVKKEIPYEELEKERKLEECTK